MARPRKITEPRTPVTLNVPDSLLKLIDAEVSMQKAVTSYSRTDFLLEAARHYLEFRTAPVPVTPAHASAPEVSPVTAKTGVLDQILAAIGRLIRRITAAWR